MNKIHPVSINKISDNVLTVKWSDDHESIYFADHLRKNCPCAVCEKERSHKNKVNDLKTDADSITFAGWEMTGRYAVTFQFSDGHKTGIFTYEKLRSLCQCDLCNENVIRLQGPLRQGF